MIVVQKQLKGQPDFKTHVYELNSETGYYEKKTAPPGFEKLPFEMNDPAASCEVSCLHTKIIATD